MMTAHKGMMAEGVEMITDSGMMKGGKEIENVAMTIDHKEMRIEVGETMKDLKTTREEDVGMMIQEMTKLRKMN